MRRALGGHVLEYQRKMLEHIESLASLFTELDEDIKKEQTL